MITVIGQRGNHLRSPATDKALGVLSTLLGSPRTSEDIRRTSCEEREEICVSLGLPRDAVLEEINEKLAEAYETLFATKTKG